MPLDFRGPHAAFLHDNSAAIDLEGSLSCGKTTVCLCKEIRKLKTYPGMHALIARWTDDATNTLLRPALEQMARIEGVTLSWNEKLKHYDLENGSRIYCFGLKTQSQDPEQRYGKIRGLPVSRIYIDQAEQLPGDIASELLLRLRPDLEQRLRGEDYPRQLTFSPNPPNTDSWLAKQFPADNHIKGRKYYSLSIWDNEHNLPDGFIDNALINYPPTHPKHQTVILGQRGPNIIGDPIYENLFDRDLHVKPLVASPDVEFLEDFQFGKHNPTWVLAQRSYRGALHLLGGVMGKRQMLEDFLPIVRRCRDEWTEGRPVRTSTGPRPTLVKLLRDAGFRPQWRENADAHDVQFSMIENISAALRRRVAAKEEALVINADPARWLIAEDGTERQQPFMAFGFEGGYVWNTHTVRVGNKEVRQPLADDEYANAMRCVENLMLNFFSGQQTGAEREAIAQKARNQMPAGGSASNPLSWMSS